jgi:hypothetical protein
LRIVFEQKYWALVLFISLLFALGLTLILYFRNKDNRELTSVQKRILMMLRFLLVFFISALFTAPLIKTLKKITEFPVIVLAVDNSLSMKGLPGTTDHTSGISRMAEKISKAMEDQFKVVRYTFGGKTSLQNVPDYTEKVSDYSQMMQSVYDNHFNQNIGALVIIGDGNFNQGENPQNTVKKFNFPVYAIGTGDTTTMKDAGITDVRVNKTAFAGNQFPVEADVRITGLPDSKLLFTVSHDGKKLLTKDLEVNSPDYFVTIPMNFDAAGKGVQYYSVTIETAGGEQNTLNNSWSFVINVLENKQKIIILSEGSHPDVGAIRNALEQQVNYDISVFTSQPYPVDFKGYNLIILNQLPSASQSCRQILDQSQKYRIPVLIIIGTKTMLPQLKMLGLGIDVIQMAGEFDEAQVAWNDQFVSFAISNELKDNLMKYPPLKVPFAQYSLDANYREFAFQRIKNIKTPKPLIAIRNINNLKTGIIFGEGIWRWRMYNYIISGDQKEFTEWVDKMVQYLAMHNNEDNFIIDFKPFYRETENIQMSAEVYNDAFELINTPEVNIEITDTTNRVFNYSFDHSNQFYRMDAGILPSGRYQFKAFTKIGTSEYSETGGFAVVPINVEQIDYQANHRLLYQIAHETNGRFFNDKEADLLIQSITENNVIKTSNYFQTILNELINLRWIFFILLILLSTEWFLRKFWGIY